MNELALPERRDVDISALAALSAFTVSSVLSSDWIDRWDTGIEWWWAEKAWQALGYAFPSAREGELLKPMHEAFTQAWLSAFRRARTQFVAGKPT